ncbi:pyridoxamine 5'-phosphate oxidase family protein [Actinokineospora auranticolor]|nr:pyridoxamine 5'-phosphate oxidase family protein [Actinokineospora auranticolor]
MALSVEEREEFLAQPHIGALAVAAEDGRAPLVVPIWYQYEPGGDLWIHTGVDSRKARLIAAAGRFSLMVERLTPTVRYVSVEGPVVRTEPGTPETLREMATRYIAPERLEEYIEFATENHGEAITIHLHPEHWLSADLGE